TIYREMPEVYRSLIGISQDADVGSMAINALIGSYGAMTIAAMALAMGAASIAGEERKGTLGLLLGNPKSRTHVLLSKAAAMVLLTSLGVLILWGATALTAAALGVSIEGMDVGALSAHLLLGSLFYGFLAMFIGAWSGNRGAAIGASTGLMVLSWFAVGVLPLVEGVEELVKAFPWYYFTGSDPLLNGIDWGHIGILSAACAVLAVGAVAGVNRRDLKNQSVGVTMLDRLRANPITEKVVGRLAGSARVSSIWARTASEYQVHLIIVGYAMFLMMGLMMGPMYAALPEEVFGALDSFPKEMIALFGGGDMSTPEGFYQIETFGMMGPIAVMVLSIAIGAGALAGEESKRTMGLLLANPIKRSRVVLAKSWTMIFFSFLIGVITFASVALGSVLGDLGMDIGFIAATCLLQTLVGLVFGALALALSAGTGKKKIAIFVAVGAGIGFHVFNSLTEINDTLADWARWSPFHYYLGNDPLNNGMDWGNAAVLAAISVVLIAASLVFFQRRDIRQTG
ncbi:ABC transporter permease subunit, partial [Candidatus Bipolaricaulota bacterium]|nr:ABC transporter permease subunit [Candidatus Bipolaricaulota bacterium]